MQKSPAREGEQEPWHRLGFHLFGWRGLIDGGLRGLAREATKLESESESPPGGCRDNRKSPESQDEEIRTGRSVGGRHGREIRCPTAKR